MNFLRKRICVQCKRPFETTANVDECPQCLIKPSKKEEPIVAQNCKEKICIDCAKPYVPTSNVQKRCAECMTSRPKIRKQPPKAASPEISVHPQESHEVIPKLYANPFKTMRDLLFTAGAKSITIDRDDYRISISRQGA
jgi:hypothetical protein